MSSIVRSVSFRSVRKKDVTFSPPDQHHFYYTPNELFLMHGKLGYLAEMGGAQGLAYALRSDVRMGLFHDEMNLPTGFQRREDMYGRNVYPTPPLTTWFGFAWETIQDPMLIILMIAGALSVILGSIEHPDSGWYEGISIVFAVFLVTVVGASSNWHQQKQFSSLDRTEEVDLVSVIRGGVTSQIHPEDIQVGDVVLLSAGAFIPADGIVIADENIKVNESRMTGESIDIKKDFYDPFLFGGTEVREGQATMLVTAVGIHSAYGRIMAALAVEPESTPLQKKLEAIAEFIGYVGSAVAACLLIVLFGRWLHDDVVGHSVGSDELSDLLKLVIVSVTIIVVAVPEGLPLAVTLSLAYSMGKMYNDKIVVHKLAACETMGNATTICSDKTGTLTQNLMTVVKVFLGGQLFDNQPAPDQVSEKMRRLLIEGVVINSKAWISDEDRLKGINEKQSPELWAWKEGNQTEVALMGWMTRYSIDISLERARYPVEKAYPFDSIKKQSSVIISLDFLQPKVNGDVPSDASIEEHMHQEVGKYRRYYKGAAEVIFGKCNRHLDKNGNIIVLSEKDKQEIMDTIMGFTKKGLRTIAFSFEDYAELHRDDDNNLLDPEDTDTCCFLGVVGIQDPLRPESYRAVRACQRAGVIVRMVTGDHLETAKFIARDCGILTSNYHIAMLGEDFRKLIHGGLETQLLEIIPRLRVLARSKPEDKELLVNWLKAHGEIVAATGDGTNDAAALKSSNVGIAMFIAGTAVAKSAAQIWILDDNFLSIVNSIMWGRAVYDNIRKFVQFQLTVNIVALIVALVGAISGEGTPLTAVQLLWVNLIMDTFAALALATEPPSRTLLDRKPYRLDSFIISHVMWRNMFVQASFQIIILFIMLYSDAFIPNEGDYIDTDLRHTMIFNTFVWFQLWNEINARKVNREMNVFEGLHKSYIFLAILVITIGCQIILVELAGSFANTTGLDYKQWLTCIAFGAGSIPLGFIQRMIPVNFEYGWKDVDPRAFEGAHLDNQRYSERRPEDSVRVSKQHPPKNDKIEDTSYKKYDDNGVVV